MKGPSHSTLLHRVDGADEARVAGRQEADLGHQQHAGVEFAAAEALDEGAGARSFQACCRIASRMRLRARRPVRARARPARARPRCAPGGRRPPSTSATTRCGCARACAAPRCRRRAGRAGARPARPSSPAPRSRRRRRAGTGGGRGRPGRRRARCCRRRRAGSARGPGCRRAPAPCRGSRRRWRRSTRAASRSRPTPYSGCTWPSRGAAHDVVQPVQVVLHRADLGQAVERAHDEEGVAQPAVAVVPVAAAVRRLRDAGGHRRDDGAGVLVLAQLERDGGADHRVLPLQRHRQAARPVAPVQRGLLLEVARGVVDAAGQRLVGPEQQAAPAVQREPGAVGDVGQRRAGVQAQRAAGQDVAQVVAAARQHRRARRPSRRAAAP